MKSSERNPVCTASIILKHTSESGNASEGKGPFYVTNYMYVSVYVCINMTSSLLLILLYFYLFITICYYYPLLLYYSYYLAINVSILMTSTLLRTKRVPSTPTYLSSKSFTDTNTSYSQWGEEVENLKNTVKTQNTKQVEFTRHNFLFLGLSRVLCTPD